MLAYILAITVALGSFALYMSAFFFPEVYRKYDLTWSGVGMFYALVLWVCAGQINGGVLLGHGASVALIGWFGWQNLHQRRALTPKNQRTPLPGGATSLGEVIQNKAQEWAADFPQKIRAVKLPGGLNRSLARLAEAIATRISAFQTNQPSQADPASQSKSKSVFQPIGDRLAQVATEAGDRLQQLMGRFSQPSQPKETSPDASSQHRASSETARSTPSYATHDSDDLIDAEFEELETASDTADINKIDAVGSDERAENAPGSDTSVNGAASSPEAPPSESPTDRAPGLEDSVNQSSDAPSAPLDQASDPYEHS
ncbi:MAG: Ycf66 family protein [Elainellaceae cyanobacterium]